MSDGGYASLGPTLLARKGGAKPAMRPQLPVLSDPDEVAKLADEQLEDLGWNDMGEEAEAAAPAIAVVVPIDPATSFDPVASPASPIVRRQQRRLEQRLLADAVMTGPADADRENDVVGADSVAHDGEATDGHHLPLDAEPSGDVPAAFVPATPRRQPRPVQAPSARHVRRAAFTLRLDPERHLKLRLAATLKGVSAQALVTGALDTLLAEFEDLDAIAARLQRH